MPGRGPDEPTSRHSPVAPAFTEGYALPLAVTVGGAVVFVLRLIRYERLTTP